MFRISEQCDGHFKVPCNVDLLYNHDSGDLLADVEFITEMASSHGRAFVGSFNTSVTTQYCVQRNKEPFADYVSCNGNDTEHYTCACDNWIDRCIGHSDTSMCSLPNATTPGHMHMPTCTCSDSSLERSNRVIGRMGVYAPFIQFGPQKHTSIKCPYAPGPKTFLGYWYSLPAKTECLLCKWTHL